MFSDTHRASSPWHTRERMCTSALVLRSFFSFRCASLVSMSSNNRVSVTILCSVVSDHICRISGWELFFRAARLARINFLYWSANDGIPSPPLFMGRDENSLTQLLTGIPSHPLMWFAHAESRFWIIQVSPNEYIFNSWVICERM